jgi:hypothetical protein
MSEHERHPEDLPWNDAPADSDVPAGSEEPEPAEVVGDEGDEHDTSSPRVPDPEEKYRADTLSERLAEEEPDRALKPQGAAWAGELVDPDIGGGDVDRAEDDDTDDVDEPGAEDAAMHIRDDDEV